MLYQDLIQLINNSSTRVHLNWGLITEVYMWLEYGQLIGHNSYELLMHLKI